MPEHNPLSQMQHPLALQKKHAQLYEDDPKSNVSNKANLAFLLDLCKTD
jgi:hypothetical protein